MKHVATLAAAFLFAGSVLAAVADWREEGDMPGTAYVGRVPADGMLMVKGWRSDAGTYVSDDMYALAVYSSDTRIAISSEKFDHRESDGAAAWTIARFFSFPGDREKEGVNFECGIGPGFTGRTSETDYVIGIVAYDKVPHDAERFTTGISAAAKVDLKTGAIQPIDPKDVACIQTLAD